MGHNSLQVCKDSSDWLQGSLHDDRSPMDSTSPLSGDILHCSSRAPMIERRLRPPHDQSLKCPRCDSTHTKFCYYNNYSLTQPRYFCKTCRRYWTKGGTLRNIPVGGGCRKNKKVSSSTSSKKEDPSSHPSIIMNNNPSHLATSSATSAFPDHEMHFSHLNSLLLGAQGLSGNPSFMDGRYANMLEGSSNLRPIDFMESKMEGGHALGNPRNINYDFMGNNVGDHGLSGFHGFGSRSFGSMPFDHQVNNNNYMENMHGLMLPYDQANEDHHHHLHQNEVVHDVKPNTKLLSLEWQDQVCSNAGKDSSYGGGYLGSWTSGVMNNFGPSATTNSLV